MLQEDAQQFHQRNRPPRVQIEYRVKIGDAEKLVELPFVMGVMADLTGARNEQSRQAIKPLRERNFLDIDAENFDKVLKSQLPRVALEVENVLSDGSENLKVDITFDSIKDFRPDRVAEKIPAMNKLLQARQALEQFLSKLDGRDQAAEKVQRLLAELKPDVDSGTGDSKT